MSPCVQWRHWHVPVYHWLVGHAAAAVYVTSSVTWPFDSPGAVSYRCCIVTEYISSRFRDNGPQIYPGHQSHDQSISHFPIGVPLEPSLCLQPFSRYLAPNSVHTHTQRDTRHKWVYILSDAMYCIGQTTRKKQKNKTSVVVLYQPRDMSELEWCRLK